MPLGSEVILRSLLTKEIGPGEVEPGSCQPQVTLIGTMAVGSNCPSGWWVQLFYSFWPPLTCAPVNLLDRGGKVDLSPYFLCTYMHAFMYESWLWCFIEPNDLITPCQMKVMWLKYVCGSPIHQTRVCNKKVIFVSLDSEPKVINTSSKIAIFVWDSKVDFNFILWPPSWPDCSPLDFAIVSNIVAETNDNAHNSLDRLNASISQVWHAVLTPEIVRKCCKESSLPCCRGWQWLHEKWLEHFWHLRHVFCCNKSCSISL